MARFGFVSTFPPTRCGLATFTAALAGALTSDPRDECVVVRVDDLIPAGTSDHQPGLRVAAVLHPGDATSRERASDALAGCQSVTVQHEYGIYGGEDGDEILDLVARIRSPLIIVLHTVLASPTYHQLQVLTGLIDRADAVVVMTSAAQSIIVRQYPAAAGKVHLIPHGVSEVSHPTEAGDVHRPRVLTWGLLGPGKGIEWGIRAIAELAKTGSAPDYRIVGQTHPKVLLAHGERYRTSLVELAARLGVAERVSFDNRYRSVDDIAEEVAAADVVLLPYDSRDQATSGVLAEATAAGKPVVATRFPHAIELLAHGAGRLVDHQSPRQIAIALRATLADPGQARRAAMRASSLNRLTSWHVVAGRYRDLSEQLELATAVSA